MSTKILVSKRLLCALIAHAQECARIKVEANASNANYVVITHLMDAAEARFLVERSNGERR